MTVETNTIGSFTKRWRLANVVQQHSPRERLGRPLFQSIEQHQRMHPYVTFRVILRRLFDALERAHLRQYFLQQSTLIQEFETTARMSFGEHLVEFVANALPTDHVDFAGKLANCRHCAWVDVIAEARSEPYGTQHAQLVFAKSLVRLADGADDLALQIGSPPDVIDDFVRYGVKQQTIYGEVATLHIFLRGVGVPDGIGMTPIGVSNVAAIGRDFNMNRLLVRLLHHDEDHPKLRTNGNRFGEKGHHVFGTSAGCDVIVLRRNANQEIAYASSHEISRVAVRAQLLQNRNS